MSRRGALVVLAKAPRPGLVKTRMCPPLTPTEAAQLYGAMLDDILNASARFAAELDLDPVLSVHPADTDRELALRAPPPFRVVGQCGRDLSERMEWAVAEAAAGGASPILLRGSDSPTLDVSSVRRAVVELTEEGDVDLVIAPDLDGGYNLVGLRKPAPGLFDHAMSTNRVLEDTLACAAELGLRERVLEPTFDIDTAQDLVQLAEWMRRGDARLCPRTLAHLDQHDLWRHIPQASATHPGQNRV